MNCEIPGYNLKGQPVLLLPSTWTNLSSKVFHKAVQALSRIGDELSFNATRSALKISSTSASRSAFGLVTFDKSFFSRFRVSVTDDRPAIDIQLTARAFLSILKKSSSSNVENVSMVIVDEDVQAANEEDDNTEGGCRVIVKLFLKHGVTKTHRLTFSPEVALVALANRDACTSEWTASPGVLKQWMEHFHGTRTGGTEEVTFHCTAQQCKIKSYEAPEVVAKAEKNSLASRPITTLLTVDVEDFDSYSIRSEELVTFALKEFKAIITFAEGIRSPLEAAFASGGPPMMITVRTEGCIADFVIATSNEDPAKIKEEKPVIRPKKGKAPAQPAPSQRQTTFPPPSRNPTPAAGPSRQPTPLLRHASLSQEPAPRNQTPLFRPPSPSQDLPAVENLPPVGQAEADDDEFGVIPDSEMGENWDLIMSQVPASLPPAQQQPQRVDSDTEEEDELESSREKKKGRWQVFD